MPSPPELVNCSTDVVKEARKSLGLSQKKAARRCGVSENTFRKAERGIGVLPSTVMQLCNGLGVEYEAIVVKSDSFQKSDLVAGKVGYGEVSVVIYDINGEDAPTRLMATIMELADQLPTEYIEMLKAKLGSVHVDLSMSEDAIAILKKVCDENKDGELEFKENTIVKIGDFVANHSKVAELFSSRHLNNIRRYVATIFEDQMELCEEVVEETILRCSQAFASGTKVDNMREFAIATAKQCCEESKDRVPSVALLPSAYASAYYWQAEPTNGNAGDRQKVGLKIAWNQAVDDCASNWFERTEKDVSSLQREIVSRMYTQFPSCSRDLIEEAFSVVLMKLAERQGKDARGNEIANLKSYIYQMVRGNLLNRVQQKNKLKTNCEIRDLYLPDDEMLYAESCDILLSCIDELPAQQRVVVELRLNEMSFSEISEQLSLPVQTTRHIWLRAAQTLRNLLQERGVTADSIGKFRIKKR